MKNYKVINTFPTERDIKIGDIITPYGENFWCVNTRTGIIIEVKNPEKYPHLFEEIIPTQTPNSQSNERLLQKLNLIKNQLDAKWYGTAKNTLNDLIIKLSKEVANGETPVEDNTVGQTLLEDEILYIIRNRTKEAYPKNSIGEAKLLDSLLKCFNNSKPIETTKEQPKKSYILKWVSYWTDETGDSSGENNHSKIVKDVTITELEKIIKDIAYRVDIQPLG